MGAMQIDTAVRTTDEGLRATLSRDWEVWGPNGGYVSAIALRAAGVVAPAGHRPASINVQYISTAEFDDVEIDATPVKKGRNSWLINVGLRQKGKLFLQAQVWTTDKSDGPHNNDVPFPDAAQPQDLQFAAERLPGGTPPPHGFWSNIDIKPVIWQERGVARTGPAMSRDWYTFKGFEADGDPFLDVSRAVVLADILPWPSHARGLVPGPTYIAPSLDLTVWFHDLPGDAEWLLAEGRADIAREGLIFGHSRIWTTDGRLIATGASNLIHVGRG